MDYSMNVCVTASGDVVPLIRVAEAMAQHAATGYGTLPMHGPTLDEVRRQRVNHLLDDARAGRLKVCDIYGRIGEANALCTAMQFSADWKFGDDNERAILALNAKQQHLLEWARANGDSFRFIESTDAVVTFDLKDADGNVVEPNFYRGFARFNPLPPATQLPKETTDQRRQRVLTMYEDEEKKQAHGALLRVARLDGRTRQSVAADIKAAKETRGLATGPMAMMARTITR